MYTAICKLQLPEHLDVAEAKLGMNEQPDRTALKQYVGVDPLH